MFKSADEDEFSKYYCYKSRLHPTCNCRCSIACMKDDNIKFDKPFTRVRLVNHKCQNKSRMSLNVHIGYYV